MSSAKGCCSVCGKAEEEGAARLFRCTGCRARLYCGQGCQKSDWPAHKTACKATPVWYDKHRKCQDGSKHEGRLELITWACPEEETGWGACLTEESDDLRRKFETEFNSDLEKFHEYWPQGMRWSCCGLASDIPYGCDHHGSGSRPCTCDYCRGGEPLPDSIYHEKTASRMNLNLRRGPDPRSNMSRGSMGF